MRALHGRDPHSCVPQAEVGATAIRREADCRRIASGLRASRAKVAASSPSPNRRFRA